MARTWEAEAEKWWKRQERKARKPGARSYKRCWYCVFPNSFAKLDMYMEFHF